MDVKDAVVRLRFRNKAQILNDAGILAKLLPAGINLIDILEYAGLSPDPDLAITTLLKFLEKEEDDTSIPERAREFIWVLGASEYLGKIVLKFPEITELFKKFSDYTMSKTKDQFAKELEYACEGAKDIKSLMSALRHYRAREFFRIGVKDLLGISGVRNIIEELSDLADSSLDLGLRKLKQYSDSKHQNRFVVIGFGKLGGYELNFLSDIDIMYLYMQEEGVSSEEYYTSLAENLTKVIGEVTESGFVFRTDLRLRPDGIAGPIAVSLPAAIDYYWGYGQTWERAALIKARPVAGDIALGWEFIKGIESFVYRKYLDYTTVEELREMKQKINLTMKHLSGGRWNVKTGNGGIRAIEFFVQTLQLINGGKFKNIRERNTLFAIDLLAGEGLISHEDAGVLKEAYLFFRDLEHKIQISDGRQTQLLPEDEELIHLARRMGYNGDDPRVVERLTTDIEKFRTRVENIFSSLFYKEENINQQNISRPISIFLQDDMGETEAREYLKKIGFEDEESVYKNILKLKNSFRINTSRKAKRMFEKLFPVFIQESLKSSDPDRAVFFLTEFLTSIGARIVPYYQLAENPETLRFLISLFANSEFLSKFLINHPELIDYLILKTHASPVKTKEEIKRELSGLLGESMDYEEKMNIMRRYRNSEILRIATNDLYGGLNLEEVSVQFTSLAEVFLDECLSMAIDNLSRKYGMPGNAGMAVIGLGKLGGSELGYNSDLDIIFLYSGDAENKLKNITLGEFFTYVAQRVISLLSTYTSEGYIFKVDTRLRPSGNAGAMVSSLDAFKEYHKNSAWLWERQALVKARFVAGNKEIGKKVEELIKDIVYGEPLNAEGKQEMMQMREKMAAELIRPQQGDINIKFDRGGIVDIEFMVQAIQIEHGFRNNRICRQNTVEAIKSFEEAKILTSDQKDVLLNGYVFLRQIENRLRLLYDYTNDKLPVQGGKDMDRLTKSLRLSKSGADTSSQSLLNEYFYWTKEIRCAYNLYFE